MEGVHWKSSWSRTPPCILSFFFFSFSIIHFFIKLCLSCWTMYQALEILWGARQTGFATTEPIIQQERRASHRLGDNHFITTRMSVMKEGNTSCYWADKAMCVGSCGFPRREQLRWALKKGILKNKQLPKLKWAGAWIAFPEDERAELFQWRSEARWNVWQFQGTEQRELEGRVNEMRLKEDPGFQANSTL